MNLGLLVVLMSGLLLQSGDSAKTSLVAESGAKAKFTDGVLDLKSGRGWLRTRQVFLDFRVEFEFKAITPEIDAAVLVRTWTGRNQWPERGFRVVLPTPDQQEDSPLLVGRKEKVITVQQHALALRTPDEWQRLRVEAKGKAIRVTLNDVLAGEFEVERFGGNIMLENRKGHVQIRNLSIRANELPSITPDVMKIEVLQRLGGKTPRLLEEVKPLYTPEAAADRIEGTVGLEAVVLPDGAVGAVRVKQSLHPALDDSAIAALRAWRFTPGSVGGKPLPVVVHVNMDFVMR